MLLCHPAGVLVPTRTVVAQFRHFTFEKTLIWVNVLLVVISFRDRRYVAGSVSRIETLTTFLCSS
jgi:hypothetical protein